MRHEVENYLVWRGMGITDGVKAAVSRLTPRHMVMIEYCNNLKYLSNGVYYSEIGTYSMLVVRSPWDIFRFDNTEWKNPTVIGCDLRVERDGEYVYPVRGGVIDFSVMQFTCGYPPVGSKNYPGVEIVHSEFGRHRIRAHWLVIATEVRHKILRSVGSQYYELANHLDGDVNNNDFDNLEWTTRSGNSKHYYAELKPNFQYLNGFMMKRPTALFN